MCVFSLFFGALSTTPIVEYYILRVEGTVHNFNISPIYTIVSGRLLRSRNVPLKISYILKPKIPYSTSKCDRQTDWHSPDSKDETESTSRYQGLLNTVWVRIDEVISNNKVKGITSRSKCFWNCPLLNVRWITLWFCSSAETFYPVRTEQPSNTSFIGH